VGFLLIKEKIMPSQYYFGVPYTHLLTSEEEVITTYSDLGQEFASDDLHDDKNMMTELCNRATGFVLQYLSKIFDAFYLARSPRIRHIATIVACYYLSIRRGNPSLYDEQYLEAIADLEAIASGELFLAELPRSNSSPVIMQNVSTDNRFPFTPVKVDRISASKMTGKESVSRLSPFYWL
jgi:hypothetical protein